MTRKGDVDMLLEMIKNCFVTKPIKYFGKYEQKSILENSSNRDAKKEDKSIEVSIKSLDPSSDNKVRTGSLTNILIYPIKSCAPYCISNKWELTESGFKFDRQWMIVNGVGICLTQKTTPFMCLIKPKINLQFGTLDLEFEGII